MIEVKPLKPEEIEDINKTIKTWGESNLLEPYSLVIAGYDNGILEGFGVIKFYQDGYAAIDRLIIHKESDTEFEFVLGKGILNFIDRRGFKNVNCEYNAHYSGKSCKRVLEMLGFKEKEGIIHEYSSSITRSFHLDLSNYFTAGKCEH